MKSFPTTALVLEFDVAVDLALGADFSEVHKSLWPAEVLAVLLNENAN